ncbi:MAG: hypothetical protein KatS3mg126_0497 [Lysobacteraceae bacterium]|nr:MAG: hypothetical protein KatS3mg126_0497 [Xanthomonadaceae bacterium]
MLNTLAAGKRLAMRLLAVQIVVVLALALPAALLGWRAALGVLMGGVAVAAGGALMAWRMFHGPVAGPGPTLMRMAGGLALKWLVIVALLWLALARLALEPLAVVGGALAALAVNLSAFAFKS